MKVLVVTNIVCHLQMPLARRLVSVLGSANVRLAATQPPDSERVQLGWDAGEDAEWVLKPAERARDRAQYQAWWQNADVVLCGDRCLDLFAARLKAGKLVCYMSERWWKPPIGIARLAHPAFLNMALRFRALSAFPMFHYLAIGGYAASDMRRLARLDRQVWQWGYFVTPPDVERRRAGSDTTFRVLWAGRMLRWKRVETLLRGFGALRNEGSEAQLTLIGRGPREAALRRLSADLGLQESVRFVPALPTCEVRAQMRSSDVYVLPSDGYEGWGAVLNEAMSEGCAVVASREAGAARSLLCDRVNGRLFNAGDWRELGSILRTLRDDPVRRMEMAAAGAKTVSECWSPEIAAERFLVVCGALIAGSRPPRYVAGPMAEHGPE